MNMAALFDTRAISKFLKFYSFVCNGDHFSETIHVSYVLFELWKFIPSMSAFFTCSLVSIAGCVVKIF